MKIAAGLGTSGTGNEQAVGLGKPVIAFATKGPQYTKNFAQAQARLLGAGLHLIKNPSTQALAQAIRQADPASARVVGLERMGGSGGAKRIAEHILELCS